MVSAEEAVGLHFEAARANDIGHVSFDCSLQFSYSSACSIVSHWTESVMRHCRLQSTDLLMNTLQSRDSDAREAVRLNPVRMHQFISGKPSLSERITSRQNTRLLHSFPTVGESESDHFQ
jgi:hypothetical protein